ADSMYEFSVRISEGTNEGKWSISVFQRTPESAPSGPPENFEVKPLRGKGTAVKATWDPPEEPNGRIKEYILSYAPAMKPFGLKTVTYRGSTTTATIEGLTPGDRYIFKIRATNRRGQGPQSKAISIAIPQTDATSVDKGSTSVGRPNSPGFG
uniref:Fibronectin type-III domain-containing protein n=1 Tax=Tetraodon nigroviridis TaxID=99883 RepID=H3D415_TETNG